MKKLKIPILMLVLVILRFTAQTTYADNTRGFSLLFDSKYFSNPTHSQNVSDVYFTYLQNNGYGLFFLGTGKTVGEGGINLKIGNNIITCNKQINGYFTNSITDFGMFPLDATTATLHDTGINFVRGGFYYECSSGNKVYTGIYGYIKWTYGGTGEIGETLENTQEIRAGIACKIYNNSGSCQQYHWTGISPLQLIYPDNFWNTARGISGTFLQNMVSGSTVLPRTTRDIGIENSIITGTNSKPYYIITGIQYSINGMDIFAKTEQPGYTIEYLLTGFDTNGHKIDACSTGFNIVIPMTSRSVGSYGFLGYSGKNISYCPGLASGHITATIVGVDTNNTKSFGFMISGAENFGNIHIEYKPKICSTGKEVIITGINNAPSYQFQRGTNAARLTGKYTGYFTQERSGQIGIKLANEQIITGDNLYANVTDIDNEPPKITITSYDPQSLSNHVAIECTTGTISLKAVDDGCYSGKIEITLLDDHPGIGEISSVSKVSVANDIHFKFIKSGLAYLRFNASDSGGNTTGITITFTVQDIPITGHNFIRSLVGNPYTTTGNWKILTEAHAGDCESDTITVVSKHCNTGDIQINGDIFTYTGNSGYVQCRFVISDGDGTITVTGEFYDCSQSGFNEICKPKAHPEIISGTKYIEYTDFANETRKYTSGSSIEVKLNAEGVTDISGYKVSCIQQQEYCKKLIPRTPNCSGNKQFCAKLTGFLENLQQTGQICNPSSLIGAWSNRIPYTSDIFTWDLKNGSGCEVITGIPYGSRNQGPRNVRVQIIDVQNHISNITGTLIPVNYTTENPTLSGTFNTTREDEICLNSLICLDYSGYTLQYANQTGFIGKIEANGAILQNGTVGQNEKYRDQMIKSGILWRSGYNEPKKRFYFDDLHERLISVFSNE